jgi:nitrogen fixation/metabolism regulation signal transduction histidine kinase
MVFRSFRFRLLGRIVLIAATLGVASTLAISTSLYATTSVLGIIALVQVVGLIRFVERTNADLNRFLRSIRYSDFSQTFTAGAGGHSFEELSSSFNEVMDQFRRVRMEKEEQHNFLEAIIQHIGVGLLSFTPGGNVGLINTAAKRLLRVTHLANIRTLESLSPDLVQHLFHMKAGDRLLFKLEDITEPLQLVMYATEIRMRDQRYMLVSLQNIRPELEEKEMEAWQNLIRVLTHEIMNSITPISSLASTSSDMLERVVDGRTDTDVRDAELYEDMMGALQTIEKRSRGLLHFVDAYRSLTLIPRPQFTTIRIGELFGRVEQLMNPEARRTGIAFRCRVDPDSLELNVDPTQIEQVLINLVQNAFHAVDGRPDGIIEMSAHLNPLGRVSIEVSDNGIGIAPDVQEKVFIPFFTTKERGSGIGLSLSRQVMRMHNGTITCRSQEGIRTVFALRF